MLNVVIIDDEEWVRYLIKGIISWEQLGMRLAGEAENGLSGLEVCARIKPEIILTDVRMPGMDGLELLENLERQLPGSMVIIISGYDDFSYAQKALKKGAVDYILKPIDEDELTKVLRKVGDRIQKEKDEKENIVKLKQKLKKVQDEHTGSYENAAEGSPECSNAIVRKVLNIIAKDYDQDIALDKISDMLYVNECYLSDLFKRETGKGFVEYLTEFRVEKARALLAVPALKLNEIADMVGFNDANYFSKIFKKYTGLTPSEFRQKNKS